MSLYFVKSANSLQNTIMLRAILPGVDMLLSGTGVSILFYCTLLKNMPGFYAPPPRESKKSAYS
jgi:hypothetical protein